MSKPKVTRGHGLLESFLARQRVNQARKLIPPSAASGRVLDIGCGSFPLFLVSTDFAEKYGLDRVPVNIPEHLRAPNLKVLDYDVQTGRDLPFEDDHFDAVTMLAVFEHLEPSVLTRLLGEIRRVLRPGGVYVMTTPAHWTDPILQLLATLHLVSPLEIGEHKGSYSHGDIAAVLDAAGFDRERVRFGYFEFGANIWVRAGK